MRTVQRLIATAGLVSLSDGMLKSILPLLVAAVTLEPTAVAAVTFFFSLPWLVVSLLCGPILDRHEPVRVMAVLNFCRLAGLGLLIGAIVWGSAVLPLLYAAAFILGSAETMYEMCAQLVLPRLVDADELVTKNGHLFGVTSTTGGFVGPALGALIAGVAAIWAVALSSVGYLSGAAILLTLFGAAAQANPAANPPARPPAKNAGVWTRYWGELRQGLRYLWADQSLRSLAMIGGLATICWYAWVSLFVLVVVSPDRMGLAPAAYGLFLAVLAAGGVVGSLTVGKLTKRWGVRRMLLLSLAGWALWFVAPGVTSNVILIGLALLIGGFCGVTWNVLTVTLRQATTPRRLLGRVTGVYRTVTRGGRPLGALLGGALGTTIGLQPSFLVLGIATALLLVPLALLLKEPS